MLFPTHLLIGVFAAKGRFPTPWVVVGAALPDLVDKPLAMLGFVSLYHSVVHSALFGVVFAASWLVLRQRERPTALKAVSAVAVGWSTHLAADALHISINGRPENTVFLLWPIVGGWDSIEAAPAAFFVQYLGTPSFYLEVIIWLLVVAFVVRDKRPDTGL